MLLLVSVRTASEASAALAGGADVIDVKDPEAGALGAAGVAAVCEVHAAVARARPVSAAIGDADDESVVERDARQYAAAGAMFVKVGFARETNPTRVASLIAAAARSPGDVVAVGYADAAPTVLSPDFVELAAAAGARGVLLDTADKTGPGLRDLVDPRDLSRWVARARAAGLLAALAGKLTLGDLPFVCDSGADIVGVRGAACEGGRNGGVSAAKVRRLYCHLRELTTARRLQTSYNHAAAEASAARLERWDT
jgi:uncharacterized protein (UPF0264 family)